MYEDNDVAYCIVQKKTATMINVFRSQPYKPISDLIMCLINFLPENETADFPGKHCDVWYEHNLSNDEHLNGPNMKFMYCSVFRIKSNEYKISHLLQF